MNIGFIGAGNMGSAIIGGILSNSIASPSEVIVSDKNETALSSLKEKYGVCTVSDNKECASKSEILFLCVKPNILYSVIDEIKNSVNEKTIIVSIAAGQSLEKMTAAFGKDEIKLIRVMPNTPALVGEGMSAVAPNGNITEEELKNVLYIFSSFGKAETVSENLMDTVTAVSGSSPAYVFMFIEAMADAAVAGGMTRDKAYTFAAQSVLGSAKMVLETNMHPGALKDMVCSPGGTTIEAVKVLEEEGLRNSVMKAMNACIEKSKNM